MGPGMESGAVPPTVALLVKLLGSPEELQLPAQVRRSVPPVAAKDPTYTPYARLSEYPDYTQYP